MNHCACRAASPLTTPHTQTARPQPGPITHSIDLYQPKAPPTKLTANPSIHCTQELVSLLERAAVSVYSPYYCQ